MKNYTNLTQDTKITTGKAKFRLDSEWYQFVLDAFDGMIDENCLDDDFKFDYDALMDKSQIMTGTIYDVITSDDGNSQFFVLSIDSHPEHLFIAQFKYDCKYFFIPYVEEIEDDEYFEGGRKNKKLNGFYERNGGRKYFCKHDLGCSILETICKGNAYKLAFNSLNKKFNLK